MMRLLAAACLVAVALSLPERNLSDVEYEGMWQGYVADFKKVYHPAEVMTRFEIFKDNVDFINHHNKNLADKLGYTVGLDEFVRKMNGFNARAMPKKDLNVELFDTSNLADSVDWTTKNAVTPVKNQGQCGSCWAFSTTGSTEGANFLKNGKLVSLSEQQLVDCAGSFGNQGCNGGLMDNGFQYIEKNGITTESSYPYTGTDGTCNSFTAAVQISGFTDVPSKSLSGLETAVSGQPTSVAVDAAGSGWQLYSGGVYSGGLFGCGQQLDHGVLAVGYDNDGGYWKIKNSWGTTWGEQGYIRLKKTSDATGAGTCGLALQASYPQAA